MKFGSKGLDAPVIIGIILAVIAAAIILYILWSKGMLPFMGGASEAECKANFIRTCNGQATWDKINKICAIYADKDGKNCINDPTNNAPDCVKFCSTILATS